MAQTTQFDPYYKWLGIPREHRPPDHYRLLGLQSYESDREVIRAAAERQTAYLQTFKIGPQSALSQRLLNEVAQARVCLLHPERKADYDRSLKDATRHVESVPIPPPTAPPEFPFDPMATGGPIVSDGAPTPGTIDGSIFGSFDAPPLPLARRPHGQHVSKNSTWGPVILVCLLVVALTAALITWLKVPAQTKVADQPDPPPTLNPQPPIKRELTRPAPERPQPPTPPPAQSRVEVSPRRDPVVALGKLSVPRDDQLAKAKSEIEAGLSCDALFERAQDCTEPLKRFALYQMTIDAGVAEKNVRIALLAVTHLVDQYDVPESTLRGDVDRRLRSVMGEQQAPPVALVSEAPRPPVETKAISNRIKPTTLAAIKAAFPESPPNVVPTIHSQFSPSGSPERLVGYDAEGTLSGATIVIYPGGQPMMFCTYEGGFLVGPLYYWSETRELLLYSEWQREKKPSLTVLLESGRPMLVVEQNAREKATLSLVEDNDGMERLIKREAADAAQQKRIKDLQKVLQKREGAVRREESKWIREFTSWWQTCDQDIRSAKASIAVERSTKNRNNFKKVLQTYEDKIKADSREGRNRLLSDLKF